MDNKRYPDKVLDEYKCFTEVYIHIQCVEQQAYDDIHAMILAIYQAQYRLKIKINKFGDDVVTELSKDERK